jgi:hypothetical protein
MSLQKLTQNATACDSSMAASAIRGNPATYEVAPKATWTNMSRARDPQEVQKLIARTLWVRRCALSVRTERPGQPRLNHSGMLLLLLAGELRGCMHQLNGLLVTGTIRLPLGGRCLSGTSGLAPTLCGRCGSAPKPCGTDSRRNWSNGAKLRSKHRVQRSILTAINRKLYI